MVLRRHQITTRWEQRRCISSRGRRTVRGRNTGDRCHRNWDQSAPYKRNDGLPKRNRQGARDRRPTQNIGKLPSTLSRVNCGTQ
jgi:hypothetical protein